MNWNLLTKLLKITSILKNRMKFSHKIRLYSNTINKYTNFKKSLLKARQSFKNMKTNKDMTSCNNC